VRESIEDRLPGDFGVVAFERVEPGLRFGAEVAAVELGADRPQGFGEGGILAGGAAVADGPPGSGDEGRRADLVSSGLAAAFADDDLTELALRAEAVPLDRERRDDLVCHPVRVCEVVGRSHC